MGFLDRFRQRHAWEAPPQLEHEGAVAEIQPEPPPTQYDRAQFQAEQPPVMHEPPPPQPPEPAEPDSITVSRTLVKSEPEVLELISSDPGMQAQGVDVVLTERGFGTRVAISVPVDSGISEADVQGMMDRLVEPQRRAFTNT
jgi:hypothetical protein